MYLKKYHFLSLAQNIFKYYNKSKLIVRCIYLYRNSITPQKSLNMFGVSVRRQSGLRGRLGTRGILRRNCGASLRFFALPPTTMSNEITIDDFPALRLKHVFIKDKIGLLKRINAMLQGGANNLQIVTDFDLTLTKQHLDGTHVLSSFGMFRKSKQLPTKYAEEAKRLYAKYRPMEIDPNLPLNEKANAMHDWMSAAQDLIKGIEFDSHELDEIAHGCDRKILRDGTEEMFEKLRNAQVPVVVFSAGLGDMVEAVLRYHSALYDNVKVISNFFKYNGNRLDGFKNDVLIHAYNKNKCALEKDYLKLLGEKQNVILMGDTAGDADMMEEVGGSKTVLKIGFLYEHVEASLDLFMEKFDIVLVDDQTMQVPMEILQKLL